MQFKLHKVNLLLWLLQKVTVTNGTFNHENIQDTMAPPPFPPIEIPIKCYDVVDLVMCIVMEKNKARFVVAHQILFKGPLKNSKMEQHVKREIEIQSNLKHLNILRLYEFFRDEQRIYLLL
ncbi:unnamed protein product [Rotaria socialis]|uniref:Aurora kinase n=1 Tax=Rotaria socialis TaxID=392032 RepID=A0A820FJX9_9BILA|nr:unnamed protein product [Rotaria socialis]